MAVKTVIEAIRDGMDEEMARDPSVFLIGEDVGNRGGVFLASDGLYKKYGELRVIDSPLAESCIVGVAIGAAVNGMRPIAEIQFADFIAPAMNQIIEEAARFSYRTAGDFNLPMVIRAPWGGGVHGALYHSQSIEATFAHVPGLKVVAPGTPADAKGLLKAAIRDPDPVLYLEHKRTYRLVKGEVPEGDGIVPIGKADVKREGKDLSLIAYGLMLTYCLEVAETLAGDGISAEVLDSVPTNKTMAGMPSSTLPSTTEINAVTIGRGFLAVWARPEPTCSSLPIDVSHNHNGISANSCDFPQRQLQPPKTRAAH